MPLAELLHSSGGSVELYAGSGANEVVSVEYDSRNVKKGSLFVAVEGFKRNGHEYIRAAIDNGAAAVLISRGKAGELARLVPEETAIVISDNTRAALSRVSAAFYGFPSRSLMVIGITGTNGKTSITYMLEAIMKRHGVEPGVIGTINYRWGNKTHQAENTTPESKDLQEILHKMLSDGVGVVIMEVSSHALELNRAEDIDFDAAVFTNLTRDHLDFHHDFDHYFNAKKRLFDLLETSSKFGRCGIVNADDERVRGLYLMRNQYSYPMKCFGMETECDYMPDKRSIQNSIRGLSYRLERPVPGVEINLNLLGKFQLYNSLAALAVAHQLGVPFEEITSGLGQLATVPGRFDVFRTREGFIVIVDYAHTVDALEKLLKSVGELEHRRIITVFGCGGDRDKSKRPLMGMAAEDNSDLVIVTSDNPRTEDPEQIIKEIVVGMKGNHHMIIQDRESAIAEAMSVAGEGDIVVIAGKGHEDYQIIGSEKIHFDDKEVVARYA